MAKAERFGLERNLHDTNTHAQYRISSTGQEMPKEIDKLEEVRFSDAAHLLLAPAVFVVRTSEISS